MAKLELIKETESPTVTWYCSRLNGEKVTPYTNNEEEAIKEFNEYKHFTPTKEVIKTREL